MAKKIPVSTSAAPLATNPFAALDLPELPAGPAEPVLEDRKSKVENPRGRVVLRREKAQRGGKTVVVVGEFASHFTARDLEELAKRAKQACGCGGTVSGREIELQGDDPARLRRFFQDEGFRVAGV